MSNKFNIVLFGSNGQLGYELNKYLQSIGNVVCIDRPHFDILDFDKMSLTLSQLKPSIIVNAAAFTDVENAESYFELAYKLNVEFPGFLASYAKNKSSFLIHFSTDAVFDGNSNLPYTEDDRTSPLNFYAETKLKGETEILSICDYFFILRISWVYSWRRKNFFLTIKNLVEQDRIIKVVNDQWGSPSFAKSIAEAVRSIISKYKIIRTDSIFSGKIYHLTSFDYTNWYDFAQTIVLGLQQKGNCYSKKIIPIRTDEYESKVIRPRWSVLNSQRLFNDFQVALPDWRSQFDLLLEEYYYV